MKAWEELLTLLEKQLGTETVSKWLRPIKILKFDAANLYLEATPFQRSWFEEHIRSRIAGIFRNNNHRPIRIHWETLDKKRGLEEGEPVRLTGDRLEESYRLDTFLPFQPMALEMARELLETQRISYNPLLFFGPSGSGKTHLLMGLASALMAQGKNVFYVHADTFTGHVVQAIRSGGMQELRKAMRAVDVLIFDDLHLLARKTSTQEEFFHTFNSLHTTGKQIILSASQAPSKLEEIEQRLISRFEWGISIPLPPLSEAQTKQLIEQKIKNLKVSNPTHLIDFLMTRFRSSPKAPLQALYALTLRSPKQIEISHLERTLSDLLAKERASALTPEKIMKQTAAYFGVRAEDLSGKSQLRINVEPRKVALFLCRKLLHLPYQTIGRIFNRDHSTVMTSIAQVEEAVAKKTSPYFEAVERVTFSTKN